MPVFDAIEQVKTLAKAEQEGDPVAHRRVVEAVHKLQLQLESPFDTALRVRFQVSNTVFLFACETSILTRTFLSRSKTLLYASPSSTGSCNR